MWYLIPFSHIIHWDGVGTRNNVQVWVTVCGNTAFLIFVHLSFIVLSSAHSSKKHRILSHLLRVISINWSPWVVPLFQERRGMMCQGMKSRCCPPSTLVCAKGSAWLWSLIDVSSLLPFLSQPNPGAFQVGCLPAVFMTTQRWEKHLASPGAKRNPEKLSDEASVSSSSRPSVATSP